MAAPFWAIVVMVNALTGATTTVNADFGQDLTECQIKVGYAFMQTYTKSVETNCPPPRNLRSVRLTRPPGITWCRLEHDLASEQEQDRRIFHGLGCVVKQK